MSASAYEAKTKDAREGMPQQVRAAPKSALALVVAWSTEPGRTGEALLIPTDRPGERWSLGRGDEPPADLQLRLRPYPQRPSSRLVVTPRPLGAASLSRDQAEIRALDDSTLQVIHRGSTRLLHNGRIVRGTKLKPGDVLEIENTLILYCTRRLLGPFPWEVENPWPEFAFGSADPFGLVGESPALWGLRQSLMQLARAPDRHVLLYGETGTGKELGATALHLLTPRRRDAALIKRSAANVTDSIGNLELFGMKADYLGHRHGSQPGLIPAARGSSLFIDEVGRLTQDMQARFLRVLDAGGEGATIGTVGAERADVRFIFATNEPLDCFRRDFLERLGVPVYLPPLSERREDIPLLVENWLWQILNTPGHPLLSRVRQLTKVERPGDRAGVQFLLHPALITWMLRRDWNGNIRELLKVLEQRVLSSRGPWLEPPEDQRQALERTLYVSSEPRAEPAVDASGGHQAELSDPPWQPAPLPPPVPWSPDEQRKLEVIRDAEFILGACDRTRLGTKKESAPTYIMRRLIWRALLHYQSCPEQAFPALLGGSLSIPPSEPMKKLVEHLDRAVAEARKLDPDPSKSVRDSYTPEGVTLGLQVKAALNRGALTPPSSWF